MSQQDPAFDLADFLRCPGAVFQGINTLALLLRMELYVDESRWKSLDRSTQISINQLIISCEDQIVPTLKAWN
jgi:hypothetical protein